MLVYVHAAGLFTLISHPPTQCRSCPESNGTAAVCGARWRTETERTQPEGVRVFGRCRCVQNAKVLNKRSFTSL